MGVSEEEQFVQLPCIRNNVDRLRLSRCVGGEYSSWWTRESVESERG